MNIGFVKDVLERAIKTFVYTLLASLSPNFFVGNTFGASFAAAMGIAASATVLSVLGSFASFGFGTVGSASLVKVQGGVQDWVTKEVLAVIQHQNLAVVVPPAAPGTPLPPAAAKVTTGPSTPAAAPDTPKAARKRNDDGTFA